MKRRGMHTSMRTRIGAHRLRHRWPLPQEQERRGAAPLVGHAGQDVSACPRPHYDVKLPDTSFPTTA
jgi:hypothetical protein